MTPTDAYLARFRNVLDHIDQHLDEALDTERLSAVAAFSRHHFHRQFSALFGFGVGEYVQHLRLKRAAHWLVFRRERPVTDIALASGYENSESFSRAFKQLTGQTPSGFRREPPPNLGMPGDDAFATFRSRHMNNEPRLADVQRVDFPATRVALLAHRGDPGQLWQTIRRFIDWRKRHRLPPSRSATFNLIYDDPGTCAPQDFRFDLCAGIGGMPVPIGDDDEDVVEAMIPAGRCARLRHIGSDDTLGNSIRFLYSTWLPASGEEPRDFPITLQRVRMFPDVPEHEAIVDIFLPLR